MDMEKLENLGQVVDEVDALGPATPAQLQAAQAEQALEQGAREWGSIAFMVGGALSMLCPELRQVYTEEACSAWGASVMPVAEKYGWNGPGSIPEIGLAISTIGLAVPSYLAIRVKLQQLKEAREAQAQAQDLADRRGDPVSPLAGVQSGAPDGS